MASTRPRHLITMTFGKQVDGDTTVVKAVAKRWYKGSIQSEAPAPQKWPICYILIAEVLTSAVLTFTITSHASWRWSSLLVSRLAAEPEMQRRIQESRIAQA